MTTDYQSAWIPTARVTQHNGSLECLATAFCFRLGDRPFHPCNNNIKLRKMGSL
jgi:hypothetical protein